MTKDELNAVFQTVHKEMLEDHYIDRLMEKLQERIDQRESPSSVGAFAPDIAIMMMNYNEEFMFRVLVKALERL